MRKTFLLIALLILVCARPVTAQIVIHEYMTYDWDSHPTLTATDKDTSNNSVIIFNRMYYEYGSENSTLYEFRIIHKRVKLITHAGIENNNKVYLPFGDEDKVLVQKARVIKSDGSVRELNKEDFKEGYYDETGKKYKYFAFEGIETGCEIEYLYCIKRPPDLNGNIINLQSNQPALLFEARYTAPPGLWFSFKSYNGCPEVSFTNPETVYRKANMVDHNADAIYTSKVKDKNIWVIKMENIPAVKTEDNSAPNAEMMKFAFKLERISGTSKRGIYSYDPLAEEVIDGVFNQTEPRDSKSITKLIAEIKIQPGTEEDSIRQVENYLKANFIYNNNAADDKEYLSKILEDKAYNTFGSVKLFANIFKLLKINTQVVLTGNRFEVKFDKDFECYSFLDEYLLYFPGIDKYLAPHDNFSRLGFPDYDYINTYGLFTQQKFIDGKNKGVGEIRFIQGARYLENSDNIKVTAIIDPSFRDTKFEITRELNGYAAADYQPLFGFLKEEVKLKELSDELIQYFDNQGNFDNLTLENKGAALYGTKPLIARAMLNSDRFIVKAGDKFLFKAGMLIGPQKGLYNSDQRRLPVEFAYNHCYSRTINFNIPEGYKVSGLEKLKSSELFVRNISDTSMLFVSDYSIVNNKVVVTVEEYYKEYSYTVAEYEEYRRVANASANFNKVVVVYEKKK